MTSDRAMPEAAASHDPSPPRSVGAAERHARRGDSEHDDEHDDEHDEHARYPFLAHHFDSPAHQFETGKLGIWIFLVTEVLFFSGLFCAYTIYRAQHPEIFVWAHYFLNTELGALNTAVLIFSSLTAAWAVRSAQLGQRRMLVLNIALTIACAFGFLGVKYVEYSHKFHDGLLWGGRPALDGTPPRFHFDPREPVWEVERFRHHHPEAAAAAERLSEKASEAKPDGVGTDAVAIHAAGATPAGAVAPTASASAAATASAPVAAASAATGAVAPTASASAAATASAPVAAASAATGAEAGTPSSAPAVASTAATGPKPTKDELSNPLLGLTDAEAKPLLEAGVLGPRAVDPNVPSRPKNAHVFFGIYFFMTGLHGMHVIGGIIVWVWLLRRAIRGEFGPKYFGPIDFAALYWHLVDLVWIYLFPLLYLIH